MSDRMRVYPALRLGKELADLAKSLKIVNVLGEGRYRRNRNVGVSGGKPLCEVMLTGSNLLPLGM